MKTEFLDFSGHGNKDRTTPLRLPYLLLYCSLRLRHLAGRLSLHVDCWGHLLLQRRWKRSGRQGHALRLDLHLDLRLGRRFHELGLLLLRELQGGRERRHGDVGGLQARRQLGRRRVQAGRVLHWRALGGVVLLLALLLPRQLHRLGSGRHPTCRARGDTAQVRLKHPCTLISGGNRLRIEWFCYLLCHKTPSLENTTSQSQNKSPLQ